MKKYKSLIIDFVILVSILLVAVFLVSFGQFKWREATIVLLSIYGINLIFIFYLIFSEDNKQEKIVWMFFLIVVPIFSHLIFALFRIRRNSGISRNEYDKELEEFKIIKNSNDENLINFASDFEKQNFMLTKKRFYNSQIKMYFHGFQAYEELFNDINNAKKYIHIEMYIIKPSEIFEQFKNLLIKKVKEGIEIKMIIDDFGSWLIKQKEFDNLKQYGIEIAIFNRTNYPFVKPSDNNRLHRKFFVIDGLVVHSGGLNISDEYNSLSKQYGYWADLSFKVNNLIVNEYESLFLYDWFKLTKIKLQKEKYLISNFSENTKNNSKILLFDEGPNNHDNLLEQLLVGWINNSNKTIDISTPYFVPSEPIFNAFKYSLKKGVIVNIYIPGKPDKKIVYKATNYYVEELVKLGANVYKLNNIFLHSKLAVFDNKFAYLGTNNLDMRSLFTNYESINVVQGNKPICKINTLLNEYKTLSNKVEISKNKKYTSKFKKIFYELFSPLM